MRDFRVEGGAELERLARQLREVGNVKLDQKMRRGLTRGVRGLGPKIDAGMPLYLPDRYAIVLAESSKYSVSVRTQGKNVWVRFIMESPGMIEGRDIPTINAGNLKKPVFGRFRRTKNGIKKNPWVFQKVRPGFFDDPASKHVNEITSAALDVLEDIARELAN